MERRFWRSSILAAFSMLAASGLAMGQTITLSFSGSGNSGGGGNGLTGSGTGTFSPGGAVALSFTGNSSKDRDACSSAIQFSLNFQANAADTLSLFFSGQIPSSLLNSGSGTLNGNLVVAGGTGVYSGKGGTGTAAILVQLASTGKSFTYTLTGTVTLGGPVIPQASVTPSGIVPVYSDNPVIQAGSWISIYGNNLANTTASWTGNFPTSLGGVTVTIDGLPAYFWFVSSGQINVQAPSATKTGCVAVVVNTPNGTVNTSVDLESIAPSFSQIGNQFIAAIIPTANGTGAYGGGTYDIAGPSGGFSFSTRPVKRGETVAVYGVGFGPTNPAVPAGQLYSGAASATNQVQISLGSSTGSGVSVTASSVALIGAGLYQIIFTVPANAPTGNVFVQATVGGGSNAVQTSSSVTVQLAIQ